MRICVTLSAKPQLRLIDWIHEVMLMTNSNKVRSGMRTSKKFMVNGKTTRIVKIVLVCAALVSLVVWCAFQPPVPMSVVYVTGLNRSSGTGVVHTVSPTPRRTIVQVNGK